MAEINLPSHDVFDFACFHAGENLKLLVLGLLPNARRDQHLRKAVEVEAHARHIQFFVDVAMFQETVVRTSSNFDNEG